MMFSWAERSHNHLGNEKSLPSAAVRNFGQVTKVRTSDLVRMKKVYLYCKVPPQLLWWKYWFESFGLKRCQQSRQYLYETALSILIRRKVQVNDLRSYKVKNRLTNYRFYNTLIFESVGGLCSIYFRDKIQWE